MIQLDYTTYNGIDYSFRDLVARADNEMNKTKIQSFLGFDSDQVLGLCVDYKNKTFERLSGARGLSAGRDFDKFSMYGGRKRCNVADDGTVNAYYGDEGYIEDGSNGQVMVYQPKFYYMVKPISLEKQETGKGYHLRKANYYISEVPLSGFKLHPLFKDANEEEVDYVLKSAYEGCIYDTSEGAYILDDEQILDASSDLFSSIANAKPASGVEQKLTRPTIEQMAKNRGDGWHSLGIKPASMEQLLMIIEMGMMNLQTAIGQGIISISGVESKSCSSFTGSTSSLGNTTGQATETKDYTGVYQTTSGKLSISYRGVENFWGNAWKFIDGINFWGDGNLLGGVPYICSDFNYADSKNDDNYESTAFTVSNANGYISAFGYSPTFDWLFLASECFGNSSIPVGDYYYASKNLNEYMGLKLGNRWDSGLASGGFCQSPIIDGSYRDVCGRLVYVPTSVV